MKWLNQSNKEEVLATYNQNLCISVSVKNLVPVLHNRDSVVYERFQSFSHHGIVELLAVWLIERLCV